MAAGCHAVGLAQRVDSVIVSARHGVNSVIAGTRPLEHRGFQAVAMRDSNSNGWPGVIRLFTERAALERV